MEKEELERHYRVIDMMLTMHSQLRDSNQRWALLVDLIILTSSVVLVAAVFVDPGVVKFLHINPKGTRIVIGICSILIFILSLIRLRVDWKQEAEKHGYASEILGKLKAECRELLQAEGQPDVQRIKELNKECAWTVNSLPKIPESKFHRLKALHKRKIGLSKMIDANPGTSLLILRWVYWYRSTRDLLRGQKASNEQRVE